MDEVNNEANRYYIKARLNIQTISGTVTRQLYFSLRVCERLPLPHLKVWLLEDPRQFGGAVIFNLETADVSQDLRHQLHIVVLHRLELHLLQLLVGLREREMLRDGDGCDLLSLDSVCH